MHGLTSNGIGRWEKEDTLWPRDLLSKAIPAAKVSIGNYNANIGRFFNKTGQIAISRRKDTSLLDLARERAKEDGIESDRSIIFGGHSLGGLVIKQPLVIAGELEHTMSEDDEYAKIIRNAVGIIFLGTPRKRGNRLTGMELLQF